MIRQILKLLWIKKRSNYLLSVEIFFSFLVLFIISSLLSSSFRKYHSPLGYDFNNIILFTISREDSLNISVLQKEVEMLPEVEVVCLDWWNSGPYNNNNIFSPMSFKNISKNLEYVMYTYVDDNFAKVFKFKLIEGRWFNKEDDGAAYEPIVINSILKKELFGNEAAAGKILERKENGSQKILKIVGVIDNYRAQGEFGSESNFMFYRNIKKRDYGSFCPMFIRTKYNVPINFEMKLNKVISSLYSNSRLEIERLETERKKFLASDIRQLIVFSTFGAFLIINVALGLFGVLWFNISRRRKELGLRRAVGADKRRIFMLITGEAMALSTVSILLGCLFAIQFPAVNLFGVSSGIYYLALLAATLIIYFVIFLCTLYPGYLASGIEPAAALHEE